MRPRREGDRTAFVGRARDLAELASAVAGGARVVTILGPGGIGKTRLARRFAAEAAEQGEYEGGVWFCDVTDARTGQDVVRTVAAALEVPLAAASDGDVDAVGQVLAARERTLVVLDNFEQVSPEAPGTVGRWSALAPEVTFVVTSREVLGLEGERRLELDALEPEDAAELFSSLAAARANRRATDSPEARATVLEIVGILERVPLAIELAAARAGVLGLTELKDRLAERLDWLKSDRRDVPARQRTLRAAMDWSWALLAAEERDALAACSVFRGGFSLEAAEAVVGASALDLLHALRNKSLVLVEAGEVRTRFQLLETVRQFAREAASETVVAAATGRHAHFYAEDAARRGAAAHGPEARAAIDSLGLEVENLLAAHRHLAAHAPREAARLALALEPLFVTRGPLRTYGSLLDATLPVVEPLGDDALLAALYRARGELHRIGGPPQEAHQDFARAIDLARAAGARRIEADASGLLGFCFMMKGRLDEGRALVDRAALAHAELGDLRHQGLCETHLGLAGIMTRQLDEARAHFLSALDLLTESGDRQAFARALMSFAALEHDLGRMDDAGRRYGEALAVAREVQNKRFEGAVLSNYACWLHESGRLDEAAAALAEALSLVRYVGDQRLEAAALLHLGAVHVERGQAEDARLACRHGVALARVCGSFRLAGALEAYLGALDADLGRLEDAERAFRRAHALVDDAGDPGAVAGCNVLEGFLDIARGRRDAAEARLAAATRPDSEGRLPPAARMSEARITARLLARRLDASAAAQSVAPAPAPEGALEIEASGLWFRSGATKVDLSRRRPLRLLLRALADRRRSTPAEPLTLDALVAAGWPGEKVLQDAAATRVYVAIAALRRMGLRDVLVTRGEGYLLHPSVPVTFVAATST